MFDFILKAIQAGKTSPVELIQLILLVALVGWVGKILALSAYKYFLYLLDKITASKKHFSVQGTYECEYVIPWKSGKEAIIYERIVLRRMAFRQLEYKGWLVNKKSNPSFRTINRPAVRVQCELKGDNYLIGWWQHPTSNNKSYGSFILRLDEFGVTHEGTWSGKSNTYNKVLSGSWRWKINRNNEVGYFQLIYWRVFGH
jgi:hypothetical protein